jgi:polyisoprenyl-phosphate glycosyltransferase
MQDLDPSLRPWVSPLPRPDHPTVSCVLPAYNEARNLEVVVTRVLGELRALGLPCEVVVVDDGSRDDTAWVLQALCARHPELLALQLSRNFGKEAALTAGLDAAHGDVVVLMDADGQHPVALLGPMVQKWREGHDMVYSVRSSRTDQSRLHGVLTGYFYRLVNWRNRVQIAAHAGDYRLMDRRVVQALALLPERHRFMKGLYAWVGFKTTSIEYEPQARLAGLSHFRFRSSLSLALTGMVAFSTAPLRALAYTGLAMAAFALVFALWVLVEYLWLGISVPGYATIVIGMMLFSGLQLLGIGVLAEYVGRLYDEVKQRPLYLVGSRLGEGLGAAAQANRVPDLVGPSNPQGTR